MLPQFLERGLGECHDPESHLIPLVIKAAIGQRPSIEIFGTDYPTPDGTAIRDYIHVTDLAEAHVQALHYLIDGGKSVALNLGTGSGYSVRQVIDAVQKLAEGPLPVREGPRRTGDPPVLVADSSRAAQILGWTPKRSDLETITRDAWSWHVSQPRL